MSILFYIFSILLLIFFAINCFIYCNLYQKVLSNRPITVNISMENMYVVVFAEIILFMLLATLAMNYNFGYGLLVGLIGAINILFINYFIYTDIIYYW